MALPTAWRDSSLAVTVSSSAIHSPDSWARRVVTLTFAPSAFAGWNMASPASASASRHASQTDARSAYFDLKKGFAESLAAPFIFPCAWERAFASAPMLSLFVTCHLAWPSQCLELQPSHTPALL